jgi:hypothetical protein
MASEVDQYDVALSFAGEQRKYVRGVAEHLEAAGVKVFFDDFEEAKLWGRDLAVHFDTVYRKGSRFVVPFVSKAYAVKAWPQHEFKSALARAVEVEDRYILPVRFDDTEIPGLRSTIGYLNGAKLEPKEVAEKILEVLGEGKPKAVVPKPSRVPKLPPTDFNPYAEAEAAVSHLRRDLTERAKTLEERGYGVHAQDRNDRFMLRVMRSGQTIYRLDVWIGGGWGDNTICFFSGAGGHANEGSTNAHGTIDWDRARGLPVVKLFNMSLLPDLGRDYSLTPEELAEEIWEEVCDRLEKAVQ